MRYRITWATGEIVDSPTYDLGDFHLECDESDVKEKTEAIAMLGFTPRVSMVTDE